jgi:hypothetical protein
MPRVVVPALLVAALLVTSLLGPAAHAVEDFGLELPPGARKVGDHRWQVDRGYDATVKFFREKFRGSKNIRWHREVSVPSVKYVHLQNTNEASAWDGLNIAQMPDGSVRLFFLTRRPSTTATAPSPSTPSTSTAAATPASTSSSTPASTPSSKPTTPPAAPR